MLISLPYNFDDAEKVDSTSWRCPLTQQTVLHRLVKLNRFDDFVKVINEDKELNRLLGDGLINIPDENGMTVLHMAIGLGRNNFIEEILSHFPSINLKDNEGKTPYHYSVMSGITQYQFPEDPNWICAKKGDLKILIHICATFDNDTIRQMRKMLKETSLDFCKVYCHRLSSKGITENIDFPLVMGEFQTITDLLFDHYITNVKFLKT